MPIDLDAQLDAQRPSAPARASADAPAGDPPPVVAEELDLLRSVLTRLDRARARPRVLPKGDAAGALIELRDALAEAKPEDQGSILEQMHRIEALSRQRGRGDSLQVDRGSPYFGHLRLVEGDRHRDVLIGQRGFVEPGGGVQIVDWRNAPVSKLFYRYEEGDHYEEQLGDRVVEGQVLARRTVAIVDGELRRVASRQGVYALDRTSGAWLVAQPRSAKLRVAADGRVTVSEPWPPPPAQAADPRASGRPQARTGKLGLDGDGQRRTDRFLPAIAALIDPRQFELVSRPGSGLIVVQGSAGSGKTTIGLHRMAYLAFADPGRFRPERMLVVVYQRALATYVSRVLPSLDVSGVPVRTFAAWAAEVRRAMFPKLGAAAITDLTPAVVVRAKSHRAMLRILEERQVALAAWCRTQIEAKVAGRPQAAVALAAWDATSGPVDLRVSALARWLKVGDLDPATRTAVETAGQRLRERTRDVVGEWAAALTDRRSWSAGFARHAPGRFSASQIDEILGWCAERERLRVTAGDDDDETFALDAEDDALLLRVHQLQRGALCDGGGAVLAYEHLMVDEVQDFGPVDLAVLLDATTAERSITLAGDSAQAIAPEHGGVEPSWTEMLVDLGVPHDRVEPLRVSYRSTREIVGCALHVLGQIAGDVPPVAPRSGAPVESFGFSGSGEATEFLAHALKDLILREPSASVALIARHLEQARLYHEALAAAEVPGLRLVADQDFSFRPGIDLTDVRQTKGLEFDIVVLLEVTGDSYPEKPHARRMLHVAMTRAAHQLWITWTGAPSPLLPPSLG